MDPLSLPVGNSVYRAGEGGPQMSRKPLTASLLGISILAGTGLLSAQSLGEVAREQRAKREKNPPTKVWTNDNIPKVARIEPAPSSPESAPPVPETAPPAAEGAPPGAPAASSEAPAEDKKRTEEYWRGRFKAARAQLADAEERQHLAEDELNLLQIQETRELDPAANQALGAKVVAKSAEVDQARAVTEKAQKALDNLQKEFDTSGAPADWSKTD
jgi:hypothetical protein